MNAGVDVRVRSNDSPRRVHRERHARVTKDAFADPERPLTARILWRPSLPAGVRIEGPAIVEEPNATTLVHPGDTACVTAAGHLIIAIGEERHS